MSNKSKFVKILSIVLAALFFISAIILTITMIASFFGASAMAYTPVAAKAAVAAITSV